MQAAFTEYHLTLSVKRHLVMTDLLSDERDGVLHYSLDSTSLSGVGWTCSPLIYTLVRRFDIVLHSHFT